MQTRQKEIRFTLRAARLINGLTQKQASKALGVCVNTLSSYENDESYPDVMMLKRMEKLYGIRYDQMLFPKLH